MTKSISVMLVKEVFNLLSDLLAKCKLTVRLEGEIMRNRSKINAAMLYFSPLGSTISAIGGGSNGSSGFTAWLN
jgi:hypothetical protein